MLDICIAKFVLASEANDGIASYWCLITPADSTVTESLFLFVSAGFSLILYLLVFFRLRGNITVSRGYIIHVHQRPKVRVGRTNAGVYIVTDDERVESHLTTVGKQMLWHPIAYTCLVLPFAAARSSSFAGISVPFPVTTFTAAVFVLSGFVNAVLFCTTRNALPERWRKRLSIGTTLDVGRGDSNLPSRRSSTIRRVETGTRDGVVGSRICSDVLDISMEKDFEIQCDDYGRGGSSIRFSTPTTPLRAYSSRQRGDSGSYHIRHLSFSPLQNERLSLRSGGDEDSNLSARAHPASKVKGVIKQVPDKLVYPSNAQESALYESLPASFHPFDSVPPVDSDPRHERSSVLTFDAAVYQTVTRLS